MDKRSDVLTKLGNSNDDSRGQCYAPVENGEVIRKDKQHIEAGKEIPQGWVEIECNGCNLTK